MNVETNESARMNEETMGRMNVETNETAAARDTVVNLAPPFHHPWAYCRPYAPPGFWTAHNNDNHRGDLVLQLGRDGAGGTGKVNSFYARWLPTAGTRIYRVRFEPISLSRRPHNAHYVSLRAFAQVNGYRIYTRELWGAPEELWFQSFGPHMLRIGFEVKLKSGGNYGEIICKIARVEQHSPYSSRSATQPFDSEPSLEEMKKYFEDSDGSKLEVLELGSLKEEATAGIEVSESAH